MRLVVDTNVFVSMLIHPGDAFNAIAERIDNGATVLYPKNMSWPLPMRQ